MLVLFSSFLARRNCQDKGRALAQVTQFVWCTGVNICTQKYEDRSETSERWLQKMAFTRLIMAISGTLLKAGHVPVSVAKLVVCWVLEVFLFLLTIPIRVLRAVAHPLQLQQK